MKKHETIFLLVLIGAMGWFAWKWHTEYESIFKTSKPNKTEVHREGNEVHDNVAVAKYNNDDLHKATLDRMFPRVDYLNTLERYPESTIRAARYKLKCFQDWVNTLHDEQVQAAYQEWIDGFQRDYDRAEENSKKPAEQSVKSSYEVEEAAKQRRADALDIPKPPKAMCATEGKTK